ncbi:bZIP transcription factor 12-like [Prosopis cineraria]|uniref:bZIP transcription factor 12-like n=1 Tax=Prosopis cineraria TaxID=364024 RepID=UPI0024100CB6|nr:bZIP transcription factor 12-like [Prosopis cineraria]
MASSKLVTTNTDLPRQSSICSLSSMLADLQNNTNNTNTNINNTSNHNDPNCADDPSKALGSMSMDDLLKSIYSSSSSDPNNNPNPGHLPPDPNFHPAAAAAELGNRTAEEVWQEMVEGGDQRRMGAAGEGLEAMTLEDFLAKAGAVREEDVRGVPTVVPGHASFRVDAGAAAAINGGAQFQMTPPVQGKEGPSMEVFGNGIDGTVVGVAASAGRGKRRVVEEPVDKATLQKQRRMIKNRESAARSRERKQAYTVELENMVTQLEAANAQLLREMAEKKKQRFNQLMENLIPVVEKRKPQRKLRRVNSAQW